MQGTLNEWKFINLNQPKESKNEEVRRVIRANAQRDFRRKQRRDAVNKHRKSLSNGTSTNNLSAELIESSGGASQEQQQVLWHAGLEELPATLQDVTSNKSSSSREAIPDTDRTAAFWAPKSALTGETSKDDPRSSDSYWRIGPTTTLDAVSVDPFNVLPVQAETRYHSYVLHHCEQ